MSGYDPLTFAPDDSLTREQLVTLVYNYAKYQGEDVSAENDLAAYSDAGSVSPWALTPMRWAVAVGLVTGRTETTLAPAGTATRAEIATIMMHYCTGLAA